MEFWFSIQRIRSPTVSIVCTRCVEVGIDGNLVICNTGRLGVLYRIKYVKPYNVSKGGFVSFAFPSRCPPCPLPLIGKKANRVL